MKQFFVKIREKQARITEWGDKNNPEIICLHGLGSTSLSFIEIGELLQDRYHILSIDLPGHGKTPSFEKDEDYGAANLVSWVVELIDIIGKDTFYLLAHSAGASIALHYAAECPERVKKMLLLDGGYHKNQMCYDYFIKLYQSGEVGYKPICSLEEEIAYYEDDFDKFIFDDKESFLETEKSNYKRWSKLLETAVYDLMREEDCKIKYHATGDTARGFIKFQYNVYKTLKFDNIKSDILLLYVDLPEEYFEIRKLMIEAFEKKIKLTAKAYRDTTHMIHWDRPNEVVEDIVSWFK